jgi:hypothetical protein
MVKLIPEKSFMSYKSSGLFGRGLILNGRMRLIVF